MKQINLFKAVLPITTASVLLAFPGGRKNSEQPKPPTRTQLVTKANWKIAKIEQKDAAGTHG